MKKSEEKMDFKIHYNKKLLVVIIILLILLGVIIFFIVKNSKNDRETINADVKECNSDDQCVPNNCCHANSCVSANKKPVCKGVFCTQECSSILDCGNAKCGCVNNKCNVIVESS